MHPEPERSIKPTRLVLPAALALACATMHPGAGAPGAGAMASRRCPEASPRRLSVASYLERLPAAPITIGLDVDDTALFSTPAFLHARSRLAPAMPRDTGTPEEQLRAWQGWGASLESEREALFQRIVGARPESIGPEERAQWERFWEDVNTEGDRHSPPKAAVRAIVRRHLERGDRIVFVTGRPPTKGATLEAKLRSDFGSDAVGLDFTAMRPKAEVLRGRGVRIYYGDSDGDMEDAAAAGAWSVRIIRSRYSGNAGRTAVGEKDECFVLEDSDL